MGIEKGTDNYRIYGEMKVLDSANSVLVYVWL